MRQPLTETRSLSLHTFAFWMLQISGRRGFWRSLAHPR